MTRLALNTRAAAGLLGTYVADAAALGLHWIYDPDRIAGIADAQGSAAFVPLDPAHHQGVPAYFAHALRHDGQLSQYGECLRLSAAGMGNSDGRFDTASYQSTFSAHFGPGGGYAGYIDRPTRGVLDNLIAEKVHPSGIDDDQLPAIARLPALAATMRHSPDFATATGAAIRVTNDNADALAYGRLTARMIAATYDGAPVMRVLDDALAAAPEAYRPALMDALETRESDPVVYAEKHGRACHLPMAMPLAFHILSRAGSYAEAIEQNIRAGGDSCGRALIIGSIMGAAHGIGGETGIPMRWVLKLDDAERLWSEIEALVSHGSGT